MREVILPIPDEEIHILFNRGWMGDGEAITELYYEQPSDIQVIEGLTYSWVSGEDFLVDQMPNWIQTLIDSENLEKDSQYFYLQKAKNNYIIFKLSGNKLTIYESYI